MNYEEQNRYFEIATGVTVASLSGTKRAVWREREGGADCGTAEFARLDKIGINLGMDDLDSYRRNGCVDYRGRVYSTLGNESGNTKYRQYKKQKQNQNQE